MACPNKRRQQILLKLIQSYEEIPVMFTGRACLPGFPEVRGDRLLFACRVKPSSARCTCRCCPCCRTVASAHGISTRTTTEFRTCSCKTCRRGIEPQSSNRLLPTQALVKAAYIDEAGASLQIQACLEHIAGMVMITYSANAGGFCAALPD